MLNTNYLVKHTTKKKKSLVGPCHVWSQSLGIQAATPPIISPHGWLVLYRKQIKNRATHWVASILNTLRHVLPSGSEQH